MQVTLEQVLLGVGGTLIVALLGLVWFFVRAERDDLKRDMERSETAAKERHRELAHQQERLRQDLHQLRDTLPERYVSKIDWVEFRGWLAGMIARIEKKIDGKVDRGDWRRAEPRGDESHRDTD